MSEVERDIEVNMGSYARRRISQSTKDSTLGMINELYSRVFHILKNGGLVYPELELRYRFWGTDEMKYRVAWSYCAAKCPACPKTTYTISVKIKRGAFWCEAYSMHEDMELKEFTSFLECDYNSAIQPAAPIRNYEISYGVEPVSIICRSCVDRISNAASFVDEPCLICMESGGVCCVHCNDGPCGRSHHAMHITCMIDYFIKSGKAECPTCRQPIIKD